MFRDKILDYSISNGSLQPPEDEASLLRPHGTAFHLIKTFVKTTTIGCSASIPVATFSLHMLSVCSKGSQNTGLAHPE